MFRRRPLIVALFALVLSVGAAAAAPSEASACSLAGLPPDPIDQFAEASTAVVVGEVVAEEAEPSPGGGDAFSSTFRVVATLDGEAPEEIELRALGYLGADCSGGPRLPNGDSFLLFLTTERMRAGGDGHLPSGEWRVAAIGQAAYEIEGDDALLVRYSDPGREPVGSAEDLIREVGDALGSDAGEVDRALAYANGDLAPLRAVPPAEDGVNPITVGGAVAVALIAVGILGGWYLRGRSGRAG